MRPLINIQLVTIKFKLLVLINKTILPEDIIFHFGGFTLFIIRDFISLTVIAIFQGGFF